MKMNHAPRIGFALSALLLAATAAHAQTFANTGAISIPGSGTEGPASPYPSTILVSGLTEPIESLTVSLFGLSHTWPADNDILLVGPGGETVLLMSDAGANNNISNVDLTFMDGAPLLPNGGQIVSGTYSPTNYFSNDTFPAPAPSGPYGSALSVFADTSGNGTWSLFVFDDSGGDSGSMAGGWSITVTLPPPPPPITYQGRLQDDGVPLNDTADFEFSLQDASSGGNEIAFTIADAVQVADGLFTVELQFGNGAFGGDDRWVEIALRSPAGTGVFTPLSPLQRITPAPQAIHARAAFALDAPDGDPIDAVFVDNTGNVGIGTTTPRGRLDIAEATGEANIFGVDKIIGFNDLRFYADNTGTTEAMWILSNGNVGIGRIPFGNRLEVEGNASKITAGSWLLNSDRRIKTDIRTIDSALDTLDKVRLVSFAYTDDYKASHHSVGGGRYLNVIAQEFAEVFPDHVKGSGERLPDGSEILQVDTYPLTIYAAAAIQELNAKSREKDAQVVSLRCENEELRKKSAELEQRLARIEAMLSVQSPQVNGGAR